MAITPDGFVELVRKEALRYQDIGEDGGTVPGVVLAITLPDPARLYKVESGSGKVSNDPGHFEITVDYKIAVELVQGGSFDRAEAYKHARPIGKIEYVGVNYLSNYGEPFSFGEISFDLQRGVVAKVSLGKHGKAQILLNNNLQGKPLEEGLQTFLAEVYTSRGTPLREQD